MKRLPTLFASLLLLSSFGCREDNTDAEQPVDMTVATEQDMTVSEDLTTNPVDLAGADLTPLPEPAEFIVLRVGDGTNALAGTAAPGFLERRKVSGGSLVGTPKALPTAVSGTNRILTITGTSTAEGQLSRSEDGRFVLVGGYDAAVGMATSSGTANRTIGRLDNTGTLDTSTSSDFLSNNSFRGVASNNGNDLWAAGASGIVYTTFGSTTKPTGSLLTNNMRWLNVFGGQLYASSASGTTQGINTIGANGNGLPKTTATATLLSGFAAQTSTSHYGFVAFDRDGNPGIDVIYVADDRGSAAGGGVQRWKLSGTTWSLAGTLAKNLTAGARGLAGFVSGNNVVLLATTAESPPRVVSFVDDGSAIDMIGATALATAATNTAYRGIALAPQ